MECLPTDAMSVFISLLSTPVEVTGDTILITTKSGAKVVWTWIADAGMYCITKGMGA